MKKVAACTASLLILLQPVSAQIMVPMTPKEYMGSRALGALGDLAAVIGQLATANQQIEDEVVTARVAFFNAPEGAARAEAGRNFETAMMKRDLHYVAQRLMNNTADGTTLFDIVVEASGAHRVDGGISPYAYHTFKEWADAVINSVSYKSPLDKALKDAMPQFDKYRAERDIVEMLFYNPGSALRATNPKPGEYLAAWLLGTKDAKTFQAANASAAGIARQVGPQRLAQIVEVLRSWSTIDSHISGPWGVNPRTALDPLIAGAPGEPQAFDTSARKIVFAEARSDFSRWHTNFVPQLNEIEQLWNQGRQTRDMETLRLAVIKRDELEQQIRTVQQNRPFGDDSGRALGELMMSRLNSSLSFLDHALRMSELNAMRSGQMNPLAEEAATVTREYLAKSSKLQLRSITNQQRMVQQREDAQAQANSQQGTRRGAPARQAPASPNATTSRGAGAVAPAPVVSPPAEDESGASFDRVIAIADNPAFRDGIARQRVFQMAKTWDYWTTATEKLDGWTRELDRVVVGVETEIVLQQDFLKRIADSVAKMVPGQREAYERHSGKRDSLRKEMIVELEALLPKLKQQLAALK
jgi:hypothetical protein